MSEVQILSPRPRRDILRHSLRGRESTSMARARIFKPAKTAMQSGTRAPKWVLAYEPATRRQPEALMGWTSAEDTLNEVRLHFETMEDAVAFANKNGLDKRPRLNCRPRTSGLKSVMQHGVMQHQRPGGAGQLY